MFGYNYWGSFYEISGMTFEFVAEKNQFWTWRRRFNCSFVTEDDTWTII